MSAVLPTAKAHRIGEPIMLTQEDIDRERHEIETEYGTADELRSTRDFIGLTLQQRLALERLDDLDFLEGK
ncbi:hypothetical protein JS528_11070 [Bifidobacterium sp. MA2]|uniref:Uncharacterized protein n=1 Tax=Bifidobacterium santillanense TaxID=2809028 RepID=A0ABS5USE8_9BIFI|nr:hypothetical protein [Bifidobacterium santillanense]MBT1173860.1 hypothetical protein [Bifidobacterium santillanense]